MTLRRAGGEGGWKGTEHGVTASRPTELNPSQTSSRLWLVKQSQPCPLVPLHGEPPLGPSPAAPPQGTPAWAPALLLVFGLPSLAEGLCASLIFLMPSCTPSMLYSLARSHGAPPPWEFTTPKPSLPCFQDLLADGFDVLEAVKATDVIDQDVGMDTPEPPATHVRPLLQGAERDQSWLSPSAVPEGWPALPCFWHLKEAAVAAGSRRAAYFPSTHLCCALTHLCLSPELWSHPPIFRDPLSSSLIQGRGNRICQPQFHS